KFRKWHSNKNKTKRNAALGRKPRKGDVIRYGQKVKPKKLPKRLPTETLIAPIHSTVHSQDNALDQMDGCKREGNIDTIYNLCPAEFDVFLGL
ncbi:jg26604, partial [Pararge aegeria aegeria]